MQIIVINSQKGGSAKTMLAKHLSVEAERAGDGPVFLIDTDPQGSLTAWHAKRESEAPQRVELPFEGLERGLELLRRSALPFRAYACQGQYADNRPGCRRALETRGGRGDVRKRPHSLQIAVPQGPDHHRGRTKRSSS